MLAVWGTAASIGEVRLAAYCCLPVSFAEIPPIDVCSALPPCYVMASKQDRWPKSAILKPVCLMLQQNNLMYQDVERLLVLIEFLGYTPSRGEPPPAGAPWLPASPTGAAGQCLGLVLLEAGDAASCRSMSGSWGHSSRTPNCKSRGCAGKKLWWDSHEMPTAQLVIPSPLLISPHVLHFQNHHVLLTRIVWGIIFTLGPLKVFG